MNKILFLFMAIVAFSFSNKLQAQQKAKWNEMEAFHDVMGATFHPSEEGKLGPLRSRSQEMADKAMAWKNSAAPSGYDKNAVKKKLKELAKESRELNKMVQKNAADSDLKKELSELHDLFHEIMEKCEGENNH